MAEPHLTECQAKWFATVRANLERDTGRTMDEWVAIARTCPETAHRARLAWFKQNHGLMRNRASQVLNEAFGSTMPWSEPDMLIDALWVDGPRRAIFDTVSAAVGSLPDVIVGLRKGYVGFARKVQFAAVRPDRRVGAVLGLAVAPEASARLLARGRGESWSGRLVASLPLAAPGEVDDEARALLKVAAEGC